MKLEMQHKHILKLIDRDKGDNGWTPVSNSLFPILSGHIPRELAIFEEYEGKFRAKLTEKGENVLMAMSYL